MSHPALSVSWSAFFDYDDQDHPIRPVRRNISLRLEPYCADVLNTIIVIAARHYNKMQNIKTTYSCTQSVMAHMMSTSIEAHFNDDMDGTR